MRQNDELLRLSWDDLTEWAGSAVVERAQGYLGAVYGLTIGRNGYLLAWVDGTQRYATRVGFDSSGQLESICTCPYGLACKHAVAMILLYIDAVKRGRTVPETRPDDPRLAALNNRSSDNWADEVFLERVDSDVLEIRTGPDDEVMYASDVRGRRRRNRIGGMAPPEREVRSFLERSDAAELRRVIGEITGQYPDTFAYLFNRAKAAQDGGGKLTDIIRSDIDKLTRRVMFFDGKSGVNNFADYSRIRERLKALLNSGSPDDVLDLGAYLFAKGMRQLETIGIRGDTASSIAECMTVVYQALGKTKRPLFEKLLWDIDARVGDQYFLLDGIESPATRSEGTEADWSTITNVLERRMDGRMGLLGGLRRGLVHEKAQHRQHTLLKWLTTALARANRAHEIIPRLERDVHRLHCYDELLDALKAADRIADAEEWALHGYVRMKTTSPWIAESLVERLVELAAARKNKPLIAAYRAHVFFETRDMESYEVLEKAALEAGAWHDVRKWAVRYLADGTHPRNPWGRTRATKGMPRWPLPPACIEQCFSVNRGSKFPVLDALVDVAIKERRLKDALAWHARLRRSRAGFGPRDAEIADAVQFDRPDVAMKVWQELVGKLVARSSYEKAVKCLENVKDLCLRTRRADSWAKYLAQLRKTYETRSKFMRLLEKHENPGTSIRT